MSDEYNWDFSGPDDAKAEIRAAVRYLLEGAAGSDRDIVVLEIMEIVREVATGFPQEQRNPLDDGLPGGPTTLEMVDCPFLAWNVLYRTVLPKPKGDHPRTEASSGGGLS